MSIKRYCAYALFSVVLTGCTMQLFAATQKSKTKAPPKKAASQPVVLREMVSGTKYAWTVIPTDYKSWKQPVICVPVPALPKWLSLDCSKSKFVFTSSDVIPDVATSSTTPLAMTVIDATNHQFTYKFEYTRGPANGVINLDGKEATPADQPLVLQNLQIELTSGLSEGTQTVSANVKNLPAGTTGISARAWIEVNHQPRTLAILQAAGTNQAPTQAPVGTDGSFTLSFSKPIPPGSTITIELVPSGNTQIPKTETSISVPSDLPFPKRFELFSQSIVEGSSVTITGRAWPMPNPPVASSSTQAGNLPSVVVLVRKASARPGEWSRADLVQSATVTAQQQQVQSDGSFSVQLKTPLTAGDRVRVLLVAPVGRYFLDGPDGPRMDQVSPPGREELRVHTSLNIAAPYLTSPPVQGAQNLAGVGTPSPQNGPTVSVAIIDDSDFTLVGSPLVDACFTADELPSTSLRFLSLSTGATSTSTTVSTDQSGHFSITPSVPLEEGQRYHLVEVFPAHSLALADREHCRTRIAEVQGNLDWGRIHADFTAGILISNDSANSATGAATAGSGNFSQAHQFYALTLEKAWSLPKCYIRVPGHRINSAAGSGTYQRDQCYDWSDDSLYPAKRLQHLWPGVSSYFQARLTAIPISTTSSATTTTSSSAASAGTSSTTSGTTGSSSGTGASSGSSSSGSGSGSPSSTSSNTPTGNLISTAQTAQVQVGFYFPFFISRWEYHHAANALFFAPLAKVGFNTVTGPATVNTVLVTSTSSSIQSETFEQVYNFWGYGGRIGHMQLSRSASRAPETYSYIDVTVGPYSNLQSYICHAPGRSGSPFSSSGCAVYGNQYHDLASGAVDSRKRIYRFDIEGLLKIPATPLYVGFNANIGQHTLGAAQVDPSFAAADDLRFFFGTKFDTASVMNKFNLGPH